MDAPPVGTVTLLMTDIEGSTRLWEEQGDRFLAALEQHNQLTRSILIRNHGYEVKTEGDSFFFVFDTAHAALAGAVELQRALCRSGTDLRIRIGINTGEPTLQGNDYFGPAVNRTARIRDAAHGAMTILSAATVALLQSRLPDGVTLLDRGEHRLRDLGASERLYQVLHPDLPQEFPPLRTLEARPNNLPAQRTSFVGRQRELDALRQMLSNRAARLVTLTGPGGVGKTRLALQVAASHLDDFAGGVWYVPLARIRDPAQMPAEIASAVLGHQPAPQDIALALAETMHNKRTLLVLDNFEQVAAAAPQLADLLQALPDLTGLVTSRALLRISGEYEFQVPSLSEPEGLQLFLERGLAARSEFKLEHEGLRTAKRICQKLDGLPLAIELAAARVRGMSVAQISQRLGKRFDLLSGGGRDLPTRQQTMRAALDWSYDLLSPEERVLLGQLSVFASGFFLAAAEAVCEGPDVLETLFALRDRSLVSASEQLGETRYHLLNLVREYAADKADDRPGMRARHAAYYLALAQEWGACLYGRQQVEAYERLDIEMANFEAAIGWADEIQDWRLVAELVQALGELAYTRGRITPALLDVVRRAAEALRETQDTTSLAALLYALGAAAWLQGRYRESEPLILTSLKHYRDNNLHRPACRALSVLGHLAAAHGEPERARAILREGLELSDLSGCMQERALLLQNLSTLEMGCGNDEAAEGLARECLEVNRALGDDFGQSYPMHTLGMLAWQRGDVSETRRWLLQSLSIRAATRDLPGLALTMWYLGAVMTARGEIDQAAYCVAAARSMQNLTLVASQPEDLDTYHALCDRLGEEAMERLVEQCADTPLHEIIARGRAVLEDMT